MGKIWVEICLISARGVRGTPSLWKRQWYAVGWVDPTTKYCTKFDSSSRNSNPNWRTKFSFQLDDDDEIKFQELALNVEVYSRDPLFLTEKLHGSATVLLKEFLAKKQGNSEEVGSYQLRKKKSSKPNGFIDLSIRVFEDKEEPSFQLGNEEGIMLSENGNKPQFATHGGFGQGYNPQHHHAPPSFLGPQKQAQNNNSVPYIHPMQFPTNYSSPYVGGPSYAAASGPSYQAPRGPPPPSQPPRPPSNVGYGPNFFQSSDGFGPSYINMPSSSYGAGPRQRGPNPGFAMGAGAGALAAGAMMFGGEFVPGFDVPSGLGDPTIAIATDPLF